VLLLIIGFAFPFVTAHIGINYTDEPYQLLLARFPDEAPAAWFFARLGHAWGSLFGWNYLTMRHFAVASILLTATVGALYFYSRTRLPRISIALAGLTVLLIAEKQPMFTWHGFTYVMVFLVTVCTLRAIEHPKLWRFILLGAATGLTILARIPNVVIVPLLAAAICLWGICTRQRRLMWRMLGIVGSICAVTVLCCVILSYGSVTTYVRVLTDALPSNHEPLYLMTIICSSFVEWSPYWAVVAFGAACVMLGHRIIKWRGVSVTISLAAAIYIGLTLGLHISDGYTRLIQQYLIGLLLSAIFYTLIKARKPKFLSERLQCIIILLLMAVPVAGSNIGVVRCLGAALYPVMAAIALPWISRRTCIYVGLVITAFIAYLGLRTLAATHQDTGARFATASVDHPLLAGLYTDPGRAAEIHDLISLLPQEGSGEQFATACVSTFYGYLAYYLADTWPTICAHEWRLVPMHTDHAQIAECMQFVNNGRRPLRVIFQPDWGLKAGGDPLENALIAAKPDSIIATDHYRAYLYR